MEEVNIEPLGQHPEFFEEVTDWIFGEWGTKTREETAAALTDREGIPGALVAISGLRPIGVLGFTRFKSPPIGRMEVWINALLVAPEWRGKGVGSSLLAAGLRTAGQSVVSTLYVYTDIPAFYEARGWDVANGPDPDGMWVLQKPLG